MKLKDFLKSFDKYDPEMEVMVIYGKLNQCDSDVRHSVHSVKPTDHWEIFDVEKINTPDLKQAIIIF